MERRVQEHCNNYMKSYKEFIRATMIDDTLTENQKLEKIFHFESLNINLAQFTKKKRVRNIIATEDRCCAYRADKDRCTRKKKDGHDVCGTHMKGTPHGMINSNETTVSSKKIEVYTRDIQGIVYYIDADNNVYNSADILRNKQFPTVIGKCIENVDGSFSMQQK